MRKICSITLALLLLVSAMFVVPATTAMAETKDPTYYTNVDFTISTEARGYGIDLSTDPDTTSDHGAVGLINRLGKLDGGNGEKDPDKFIISNDDASDAFNALNGFTYTVTFDYKAVNVPYASNIYIVYSGYNWANWNHTFGNKFSAAELAVTEGGTEWKTATYTLPALERNWCLGIGVWSSSSSLSRSADCEVYIDNVTVEAHPIVNYNGGSVTVDIGGTYEDALPQIPYAAALYLDEDKTQVATGVIDGYNVTVYPEFNFSNTIDFSETVYENANTSILYNDASVVDLTETEPENGKVGLISRITGTWANDYKNAAQLLFADTDGDDSFKVLANQYYNVTFDYKIVNVTKACKMYVTIISGTGWKAAAQSSWAASIAITDNNVDAEWASTSVNIKVGDYANYKMGISVWGTNTGNTSDYDQTIYIDNVVVTPLVDVTMPDGSVVTANPNGNIEDNLTAPADQHIEGYYLDEACTIPAKGEFNSLNAISIYQKYYYGTKIDFEEELYTSGVGYYYATIEEDPLGINGNSIKYTQIGGTGDSNNANNWNHVIAIANNFGNERYAFEAGGYYKFSYDIYKKTLSDEIKALGEAGTRASVQLGLIASNNGLSNGLKASPYWVAAEELIETDGWETHGGTVYIPAGLTSLQPVMFIRIYGDKKYDGQEIYFDNIKIEKVFATAPSEAGLFSTADTEANEAAGITGTEGSAVYTVGETEYAAFRVFGEYIAPANADGDGADTTKIMKADGTTATIASRHMMLGYKTTPNLEANYAMSTAEGDALANYWSVTPNADGTYTVRYSLLLKNIPEAYQKTAFNARGAIVTAEGETIYTNTQVDISATVLYNKAVASNAELVWFGGVAGAVE